MSRSLTGKLVPPLTAPRAEEMFEKEHRGARCRKAWMVVVLMVLS